jgi:hypothetical protein
LENKHILKNYDEHTSSKKEKINLNVLLNQDITNKITLNKDRYGNFNALANAGDANKCYSNLNTSAKLKELVDQRGATDSFIADEYLNEREMVKTRMHFCVNAPRQKLAYRKKDERDDHNNANKIPMRTNVTNDKNVQHLIFGEAYLKESKGSKCNKEKEEDRKKRCVELRVNAKIKRKPVPIFRKAKSFFRKKSHLAVADSDYTLILPGHRGIKGKRYKKLMKKPGLGSNAFLIMSLPFSLLFYGNEQYFFLPVTVTVTSLHFYNNDNEFSYYRYFSFLLSIQ